MKVIVISDVHADIDALKAVEDAEGGFDFVLCAGDLVDWGMYPAETIQWFREHKNMTVSGNHDRELLALWDSGIREPAGEESSYLSRCVNLLGEEDIKFLRTLPLDATVTLDGFTYYLKHTHIERVGPDAVFEAMCNWKSQIFFDQIWEEHVGGGHPKEKRRIIFGHSHQCWMHLVRGGSLFLNPGSIHYRKRSDAVETGADYIVIADGVPVMKHVDYPTAHTRELLGKCKFRKDFMDMAISFAQSRVD